MKPNAIDAEHKRLAEVAERNRQRAEQAIQKMGTKYACHPLHSPVNLNTPKVLGSVGAVVLGHPRFGGSAR